MKRKYLNEEQYDVCMRALGYIFEEELGHYFLRGAAFLGNVQDNVNNVDDLLTFYDNGYPTFMAQVLDKFMSSGANLIIGDGAIDDYGKKYKKGLYCTNYRELFSDKKRVRSK